MKEVRDQIAKGAADCKLINILDLFFQINHYLLLAPPDRTGNREKKIRIVWVFFSKIQFYYRNNI